MLLRNAALSFLARRAGDSSAPPSSGIYSSFQYEGQIISRFFLFVCSFVFGCFFFLSPGTKINVVKNCVHTRVCVCVFFTCKS